MKEKTTFNRREFLKVIGATSSVAAAGCAQELPEKLIGYVVQPDELIPGIATWYAGACNECPAGCGTLIRTREGRAVKVEGNPAHPVNRGGICAMGQSAIQAHYDPDRVREPLHRNPKEAFQPIDWKASVTAIADALKAVGDENDAVLLTPVLTGSLLQLVGDLQAKGLKFRHFEFDLLGRDLLDLASSETFGANTTTHYDFSKADVVVSVGADYLETWISPVEFSRQWAERRKPDPKQALSYCVHVEPRLSLTGANADRWVMNAPDTEVFVLAAILKRLGGSSPLVLSFDEPSALRQAGVEPGVIDEIVRRLKSAKTSLVVAGGTAARGSYALECAVLANLINDTLGNVGKSVIVRRSRQAQNRYGQIVKFADDLSRADGSGKLAVCIIADTNPAFLFPANSPVRDMLAKSAMTVHITTHLDETSDFAHYVLPKSTNLESWNDSEPTPGVWNLNQPSMQPLYQSQSIGDSLLAIALAAGHTLGSEAEPVKNYYDYLRAQWRSRLGKTDPSSDFENIWSKSVERGGNWNIADSNSNSPSRATTPPKMVLPEKVAQGRKLHAFATLNSFDGRGANRPWMQELPHPISTAVWGSWLEMHPSTAKEFKLSQGDVAQVVTENGAVAAPVFLTEYVHPDLVGVPLGQGHSSYGRYAASVGTNVLSILPRNGTTGGNSFTVSLPEKGALRYVHSSDKLVRTQGETEGSNFQGPKRGIIRTVGYSAVLAKHQLKVEDARLAESGFEDHPTGAIAKSSKAKGHDDSHAGHQQDGHHGAAVHGGKAHGGTVHHDPLALGPQTPPKQMYRQMEHPLYRWGMSVDLASCTGCSACVVACYAENNIPVVGKDLVARGREMSWIRIDRYFDGPPDRPVVGFLPMFCQHCSNAPCEPVCPVYATYHNEEGLNTMVYNRCVGTRYCSNNCSYKVRRFNWFKYQWPEPLTWQLNPDVTVREVGIMEKCTFCVQRIIEAKNQAKNEGRAVRDGEVKPACAATCPTDALTFGNLLDDDAKVTKNASDWRAYKVLDQYINTQPAVSYLARVQNDLTDEA